MTIKATFGSICTAGSDVNTSAQNIQTQLDDLDTKLKPLLEAWGGAAQQQFNEKRAQWRKLADELVQINRLMAQHLGTSAERYQETERICAQSWSG